MTDAQTFWNGILRQHGHTRATPQDGWLPIHTAPHDGTFILAAGPNNGTGPGWHMGVVQWFESAEPLADEITGWYEDDGDVRFEFLTHWRPLPNPPEGA